MRSRQFSFSEAKKIPITTYLLSLGLEPARVRGIDYWYYSPFRQERTPSFKVNTRLNVWFDHGTGGGWYPARPGCQAECLYGKGVCRDPRGSKLFADVR